MVLREEFKRTAGMCGVSTAHLCFASPTGHATQQVPLWSYAPGSCCTPLFPPCVSRVSRLFLTACLKTCRICVAEIRKGLTWLQNLTFKDLKH